MIAWFRRKGNGGEAKRPDEIRMHAHCLVSSWEKATRTSFFLKTVDTFSCASGIQVTEHETGAAQLLRCCGGR